ncbi:MAG: hypothetical protein ACRECR_06490, partial [Thermoplasmata archaeon]
VEDEVERLRRSMGSGPLGREEVVAHLRALERRCPEVIEAVSPEEESRVLELSRVEFLRWVGGRLARLEAAT